MEEAESLSSVMSYLLLSHGARISLSEAFVFQSPIVF